MLILNWKQRLRGASAIIRMHHAMGSRQMKSRAKTIDAARTAERAPKSIRPSAPARKSVPPKTANPWPRGRPNRWQPKAENRARQRRAAPSCHRPRVARKKRGARKRSRRTPGASGGSACAAPHPGPRATPQSTPKRLLRATWNRPSRAVRAEPCALPTTRTASSNGSPSCTACWFEFGGSEKT